MFLLSLVDVECQVIVLTMEQVGAQINDFDVIIK
jgi:hypothetical protein